MSSGFITESEILEARRKRQEEWEKVRTEDQPKEAPEEPYDTRPLYQRLEEQRMKRDAEYEETHKLKNMIRGLDDDEVGFLDLVERTKAKAAQQISIEEQREMHEFRERVSTLAETEEMTRLRAQLAPTRPSQPTKTSTNKLHGVVVKKRRLSELDDKDAPPAKINGTATTATSTTKPIGNESGLSTGALRCVGVLPGLGPYHSDSSASESDNSSDDEKEKSFKLTDVFSRREDENLKKKAKEIVKEIKNS